MGMLVSPENTPSVAEGTAVQKAAAAIVRSVCMQVFSSTQFKWMMLCHDGAKQIAQQLPELAILNAILLFADQFCCRLLKLHLCH